MIRAALYALGLVAIVEGLVLALAPTRLREALAVFERLGPEQLRLLGLLAVTAGIVVVWLVKP